MAERKRDVLVEEVGQELGDAQVGPATVNEEQALQVSKLSNGVVARKDRLHTFLAVYANADVSP